MLNLTQLAGVAAHVAGRPVALVHSVESLLEKLNEVAVRAIRLLDTVEGVPGRVVATASQAEGLAAQVDSIAGRATEITARADQVTDRAAALLTAVQPLVDAVSTLDPVVLSKLEPLLEDVIALLPALASLPPTIDKLATQVDHLDQTVADVGALLHGIPGAARLLKRGSSSPGFPAR